MQQIKNNIKTIFLAIMAVVLAFVALLSVSSKTVKASASSYKILSGTDLFGAGLGLESYGELYSGECCIHNWSVLSYEGQSGIVIEIDQPNQNEYVITNVQSTLPALKFNRGSGGWSSDPVVIAGFTDVPDSWSDYSSSEQVMFGEAVAEYIRTVTISVALVDRDTQLPQYGDEEYASFDGLFYGSNCPNGDKSQCEAINPDYPLYEGMTYHPHYTTYTYTVSYDTDGGEEIEPAIVSHGEYAPLPTPVKEGHTFLGWYDNRGYEFYEDNPITSNTTVYAHWEVHTYTVTYDSVGGEEIEPATVSWGCAAPEPVPTREQRIFMGWHTEDGELYSGAGIKADTTLYAYWRFVSFSVDFFVYDEIYTTLTVEHSTRFYKSIPDSGVVIANVLNSVPVAYEAENEEDPNGVSRSFTNWEKAGNYISKHHWVFWVTLSVIFTFFVMCVVLLVVVIKRK